MFRVLLFLALVLPWGVAFAEPLWQTLPPTPPPVPGEHTGHAKVNGISLYYATFNPEEAIKERLLDSVTVGTQFVSAGLAADTAAPTPGGGA